MKTTSNLLKEINDELIRLGYRKDDIQNVPPIISRVEITLQMAHLYYFDNHVLRDSDKHWCSWFSIYNHFFDNKYERLGKLYSNLIDRMKADNCFNEKPYKKT